MVVFILAVLVAFNALYVAAEFAAVSVRRSRIHQEAESGNGLARRFLPYLQDPLALDRYVATCQIGITISSLVLGAYGQSALSPLLMPLFRDLGEMQAVAAQSTSAVTILLVLTALQMILGELVPKSLALQYPTKVALYTVIPLQWSVRVLSWFIAVLNGSGHLILRAIGVEHAGHVHIHSPDEIEYLIAESREGGLLDADEHTRLREALRLGITSVAEVMVPRTDIAAVPADAPPEEMLRFSRENPYSRFPVYRGTIDEVVGYVHLQDLARVALGDDIEVSVREITVLPATATLEQALQRLRREHRQIAIVVDEYGGTAGLLTIGDILEDIFGGIADEFKAAEPRPQELPDGGFRVWGAMRRVEAAEELGVELGGNCFTVGGFVMERLQRVPQVGDEVAVEGATFKVESMHRRRVQTLVARLEPSQEASDE